MQAKHFDIIIVGAGVAGIGAACRIRRECKGKRIAILERRKAVGGTWDLFRYPGIRSDSDMFTFGYDFKPWNEDKILADGPAIKRYVAEAAREFGVDKDISFGRKVESASWSSERNLWTLEVLNEDNNEKETYTSQFFLSCTGYYSYDEGYRPTWPGEEKYKGKIIHPQFWPEDFDYSGMKVIIIGSGATAVTLVPAMADKAAHITMLQRSPAYVVAIPPVDFVSKNLRRFLPDSVVYFMGRARNILMQRIAFTLSKARPAAMRRFFMGRVRSAMGPGFDMKHFTPKYNPWDQRLAVVPDGDMFEVIKQGKASVVTDEIETFTEKGIRTKSGEELEADLIITATGLLVRFWGGMEVNVDGKPYKLKEHMTYKGVLCEDLPNATTIFGYTNSSYTLKVDIACTYICRLINYMDKHGYTRVVAVDHEGIPPVDETSMGGLTSGYILRAKDELPKQGSKGYWQVTNDYMADIPLLRFGAIEDEALEFSSQPVKIDSAKKTATSG